MPTSCVTLWQTIQNNAETETVLHLYTVLTYAQQQKSTHNSTLHKNPQKSTIYQLKKPIITLTMHTSTNATTLITKNT